MTSRLREMASGVLGSVGVIGAADVNIVYSSTTAAPYLYWKNYAQGYIRSSISNAHTACTSARNDVVLLTPEAHSITSAVTWSKNMTHLVGMHGLSRQAHRARITHGGDYDTMFTISGYGNTFANFQIQHGRTSTTNKACVSITGNRNNFTNVHFNGAINAAMADQEYSLIKINAEEFYFKDCYIGADNIFVTGSGAASYSLIDITASAACRGIFENCVFVIKADSVNPVFIKPRFDLSEAAIFFKGCQFVNIGTSTLTYGIDGGAAGNGLNANCKMYFDANCSFDGVTDITSDGNDAYIRCVTDYGAVVDEVNLMMGYADHTV